MLRIFLGILVCLALFGWMAFQLFIKKKHISELRTEALVILFFTGTWVAIYYWLLH